MFTSQNPQQQYTFSHIENLLQKKTARHSKYQAPSKIPSREVQRGGERHREREVSEEMSFNQTVEEPLAAIRTGVSQ